MTGFFIQTVLSCHSVFVPQVLTRGLHSFLLTGLTNNKPLVMVGTAQHIQQAMQNITTQLPDQALNTYYIYFFVPSKETVFKREVRAMMIVTATPVTFMVCAGACWTF